MDTLSAITQRRSIRKFKDKSVSEDALKTILRAATLAPSGKNRQPWHFIVVQGEKRDEMVSVMQTALDKFHNRGENTGSAKWTLEIMAQTPVTVFIFNPDGIHPWDQHSVDQNFSNLVNLQSIGAAIQNMCLTALDMGLGTLWIADVLYAYEELSAFLGMDCQMVAALSIGYPDESPTARKRKPVQEVTTWL
jgi:nitroreductase